MHFILKCTIEPDFLNREFDRPIADDLFVGLEEEIISAFEISAEQFAKNLELVGNNYRFWDFISDAFDTLSRYAVGCLFLEKNIWIVRYWQNNITNTEQNFFTP